MNNGENIAPPARTKLGRYELLKRIGLGGMGEVWLAEDPSLHRQVAVKTLPIKSQNDNEFLQRFELEARAAAALNHPHILPIHDFGTQPFANNQAITYIVMPYISGGSLDERVDYYARTNSLFPLNEALEYLSQAADAIDYAHTQGVIHRDIKPGNMLLRNNEWLLLTDFGIARMLSSNEKLTQTGVGFGTPEYMAPEQAQGRAVPASDNYSLAVIAYRLLSGRVPFSAESSYATTMQHILNPPTPPSQFNPAISPYLERAILHGLEKDPANRPASARAFVAELKASAGAPSNQTTIGPVQPATEETKHLLPHTDPPYYKQSQTKNLLTRREVLLGGGALLVVGGGAAIWAATNHGTGPAVLKSTPAATKQPTSNPTTTQNPGAADFVLQGHNSPINTLAWSGAGNKLYSSAQDKFIKLWDIDILKQQGTAKINSSTASLNINDSDAILACSPDGSYIAIGNLYTAQPLQDFGTKLIKIYKADLSALASGFETTITLKNVLAIEALNWAPNKYLVISNSNNSSNLADNSTINTVLDPTSGGKTLPPFKINSITGGLSTIYQTHQVAVSPDGTKMALAATEGVILGNISIAGTTPQWQKTGTLKFGNNLFNSAVSVSWSPDSRYVAATSEIGDNGYQTEIEFWDARTMKGYPLTLPDHQIKLTNTAWSTAKGSQKLAACDQDGAIYIWNAQPGSANSLPVRTIKALPNKISDLTWSADGALLAVAYQDNNNSILIWRM